MQATRKGGTSSEEHPGYYTDSMLPSDSGPEDDVNLLEYWRFVLRHKYGIIGLSFVFTLFGALTAFSLLPMFKSTVTLLIELDQPKVISLDPLQNVDNSRYFFETQYEIMRSKAVAATVIDEFSLDTKPEFRKRRTLRDKLPFQLEEHFPLFTYMIPKEWLERKKLKTKEEIYADVLREFRLRTQVSGEEKSQVVHISFEASDPVMAADIANALAQSYIQIGLDSRKSVAEKSSTWLTERIEELRVKLAKSEEELQKYQARVGLVDSERQQDIISGRLKNITAGLVDAQTKRVQAETRYNQVIQAEQTGRNYESLQPVLAHPLIQKLKEEESRLNLQVSEMSERYGSKHPKMVEAISNLKESKARLKGEVAKVVDGIRRDYEMAKRNERELKKLSENLNQDIRNLRGKEFKLAKLERDVSANRQLYEIFLSRFKETEVSHDDKRTNIMIIDKAEPAVKPFKPNKPLMVILFFVLGLFFGVLLAIVREQLDRTFKLPTDVERVLKLPVLGALPLLSAKDGNTVRAEHHAFYYPKSAFAEAANNIRTSILFSNLDKPPKVILVTSGTPNEGKTTLSSNLASSFGKLGSTLLIDADLRKPGISEAFEENQQGPGLTGLVAGHKTLKDSVVLLKEGTTSFYILPSGALPHNPLEFVSSKKFAETMVSLRKMFKYIIIDSAPVLPYSDPLTLGHMADAIVMLVKADHTSHHNAQNAVKRFASANLSLTGIVLGSVRVSDKDNFGGYYYYSQYMVEKD